ncbi:phage tail tape measure protein [Escherichia coli]|uniref:phage tail tape measure protein n=1 Tax=Escherichia coli TaxID=562 RepID=UPI000DA49987|nr:phage tail tape measure protein [Escherichia coli]EIP4370038.1 phage tail tape measure protein [Escherichia coli]MBB7230722.1 phage tail tape measure protein [Escherichia coli]SQZ87261.1 putative tail tape measure protein from bacteriophage origin [Escherichia coli]
MSQQRLELLLELTDRLTRPLRAAGRQVQGFAATSRGAFRDIATGGAALWGVGAAIQGALMPAIEMDRALGEVKSLGVAESGLRKLSRAAVDFTMEYGGAAQDFVRASYSIQSAIAGLTDDELSRFTTASATVAAATKSNVQTITSYMGVMYGVFQKQANEIGKSKWVDIISGQTAKAVEIFRTDGNEISAAFSNLGAAATVTGIDSAEQFAVLGKLQSTWGGAVAGTAYKSFLASVGKAQKTLGLNFTNKDGTMKGITEILQLIRGKYGDLSKMDDLDLVQKAFGDQASGVVKLLIKDIDGLRSNIDELGSIKGMDNAIKMAQAMADPWEQAAAIINGIRIEIGTQLLPVLYPFIQKSNEGGKSFVAWLRLYPNITRAIGLLSAALLGIAAVGAVVNIMVGVAKFVWTGLRLVWLAATAPLKILILLKRTLTATMWAFTVVARTVRALYLAMSIAMGTYNVKAKIQLALLKLQRAGLWLYSVALGAAAIAMKIYTAVTSGAAIATQLLFSPITLIILALAALGVGIYFLITRWDEIKAALMDTAAFQWVAEMVSSMGAWFGNAWNTIQDGWNALVNYFSTHSPLDALKDLAGGILNIFSNLWELVKQSFSDSWGWIVGKLNMIPGVNIDTPESTGSGEGSVLTGGKAISAGPGGIAAEMQNNSENQTTIDNSRRVVNVNVQDPSPARLNEWMELHAY